MTQANISTQSPNHNKKERVISKEERGGGIYYEWENIRNGSHIVFEPMEMTLILSTGLGEPRKSHTYAL